MTSLLGDAAVGTWSVDTIASSARFLARDVLRRPVAGTLPLLAAGVEVSPEGAPTRVWADLDTAGVSTGNARRDRDLRGRSFFDVERGGVLRFTAGAARAESVGRWLLPGELALGDARCPLEVDVAIVSGDSDRVAVRATATLDRRDIGIRVPSLLVGCAVAVVVDAVLVAPIAQRG